MALLVEILQKWGLIKPTINEYKDVKHPDNVPGKYWVACSHCCAFLICVDTAPNNFRYDEESKVNWSSFVYKQPETEEEEAQCRLAMEICPVDAIRDNGTQSAV